MVTEHEYTEARWWHREKDRVGDRERTVCTLCPRRCRLAEGQSGFCQVRRNIAGRLYSLTYGHPTSCAVDPIEKKPLYHFLPGSQVVSFGTLGCNLACRFCQNWQLSRGKVREQPGRQVSPDALVELARQKGSPSIAYTYNEPTVFAEYLVATARRAREHGIRNVMVSNGYISPEARPEVMADIDGINVDLKGFSEDFYRHQSRAHLAPVLDTLTWIKRETTIWLEVTTLLIPGLNDDDEMVASECAWLVEKLGPDVPLHLTAFHPDYEMRDRPRTPAASLSNARRIALSKGLHYVYLGNVADSDGQSTACPNCGAHLITRTWHHCAVEGLDGPRCRKCGTDIAGVW
jgi:pyruvate formate lyase activating enzyme